jgi:hypothetical protein
MKKSIKLFLGLMTIGTIDTVLSLTLKFKSNPNDINFDQYVFKHISDFGEIILNYIGVEGGDENLFASMGMAN